MTNREVATQLQSIKEDSQSHITEYGGDEVWQMDVIALDRAIKVFERKAKQENDICFRILFGIDVLIVIAGTIMLYGAIGDLQLGIYPISRCFTGMILPGILLALSGTNLVMIWRGVGMD